MMLVHVENLPENTDAYRYFTVRLVDGKVWFYGAWLANQADKAITQAHEINGFVVENPYNE